MVKHAPKESWTSIPVKRSIKDKYDEAARRTRFALNVVAEEAIDRYLAALNASEATPPPASDAA